MNQWLAIPYKDYGRDLSGVDCWGLVRLVWKELRGEWLPSYGLISPSDKTTLTGATLEVRDGFGFFQQSEVRPGAIATCWRGDLCLHVGVVVKAEGRLAVLEAGRSFGVRWKWKPDFDRLHAKVIYYDTNHGNT
jgi:cell wall-associated NlpC family hydrolase